VAGCERARPWTYDEATRVLGRVLRFGVNPSLDAIAALTEALGRPQDTYAGIQITGTNGKSSTARLTAGILRAHGMKVGLYTSPELERYPERIEVGGEMVSDAEFALCVGVAIDTAVALWGESEPGVPSGVTEFELLTAAALWRFSQATVDVAVLEVGMGGRWDATSVIDPAVAVITGVGLDHTGILGDTVEEIAAEKAAIICAGSVCVLGPGTKSTARIMHARARSVGARVVTVDSRWLYRDRRGQWRQALRIAEDRRAVVPGRQRCDGDSRSRRTPRR
jgi:dihydrofolate synthase/folylpolyglutamate synthase